MTHTTLKEQGIAEEDKLRAGMYGFLSRLLLTPPTSEILRETAELEGDSTDIGQAFVDLAKLAANTTAAQAQREYEDLFIGIGRGELLPYGSYYLTGFLNEKPLAKLRNALNELGIERKETVKEPEDHIGTLMEIMEALIVGKFDSPSQLEEQRKFYTDHIENWAGHFFSDLEKAESARLYRPIGTIGRLFLEIESAAFSME